MTYSYDVSYEEKQVILECYERILCKIVFYLKSLQNQNVFEDFFACVFLLFDGFLSSTHTFTSDNQFEYVFFRNLPYYLYPLNGIGCCRHTNEILFLIFQKLGYEVNMVRCELQEKGNRVSSFSQNHIVLQLNCFHQKYFLDLINWNIGIIKKHEIVSWHEELLYRFSLEDKNVNNFDLNFIKNSYEKVYQLLLSDLENLTLLYESNYEDMQRISEIIKKYETYARLHIKHVYH